MAAAAPDLLPTGVAASDAPATTEQLLVEAHRAGTARAASRLDAVVAQHRDDLRGCLEALLPLDAARRRDWSVWFALWTAADTSWELEAEHRRWLAVLHADLRRVAAAAAVSGRLPTGTDVDALVRRAIACVHQVAVQVVLAPDRWPATRQLAELDALRLPVGDDAAVEPR